ncbi:class I SAM-dependent methyltransferase [Halosolutus gelatinilyticus]|uniref:class I SAM-dependent methyltransferase n=1 Tax=Halosolutus gelatinilyticus TaxID=2931975 RepID=UPI001FF69F56|nr:class I SAM-dependent methyltransferase [Halosolutus gelatinilyticus]
MDQSDRTEPESFYDEYGEREWERLDRDFFHRLEWEGTIDRLEAHLPPASGSDAPRVLDIGGGAGRYSVWLARRGYKVTLAEPSETQRTIAREKIPERDVEEAATVVDGDVRDLAFDDDAFDATCCLGGPLSHVLDADERRRAARELKRVTNPGEPVFVSVMGLLGIVLITAQYAGRDEEPLDPSLLPAIVREGDHTGDLVRSRGTEPTLFDCHFFRRDELEALLSDAGLAVETIVALEGVAATRRTRFDDLTAADRDAIREVNDLLRTDRSVADLSPHMLAVCRA